MGKRAGQIAKVPEVKKSSSNSRVRKTEGLRSMDTPVNHILFLQRTAGNQAVSRLIKSGALQAKLRIGQPGDVYEQEADRVADEVMRMPEPEMQRQVEEEEEEILQTKPLVDQITPVVQRQVEEEEEEEMLQAKSREDATPEVSNDLESQINAIKGGGRPLAESERAYFEPRFGHDFSQVRVHADARAAEAAQALNARAFTVGQDIFFANWEYSPLSTEGRRLLSHELTHTLQQSIPVRTPAVGTQGLQNRISKVEKGIVQRWNYILESVSIEGNCPRSLLPNEHSFTDFLRTYFKFHPEQFGIGLHIPEELQGAQNALQLWLIRDRSLQVNIDFRMERGSRQPKINFVIVVNK